ncbi:ammonium transporter [Seleniivibrio sp.]|uniref:ammonium transporter n=1 Tax=Seleniivibrio sp. TaxID=2898801 RepID=UPI0025DD3570|nr:ammonium transporter [Seleniivibrio sp.]MCD8554896.1 ammonium transporter [Seleniivibrio sp.]
MKKSLLTTLLVLTAFTAFADEAPALDTGDTAWLLMSSALVLLMMPGLALFYGGMVRAKNVLSTFLYSFTALTVVGVVWMVIGFTLAFGETESPFVGSMQYLFMGGDFMTAMSGTIPLSVFAMFQGMFAIITVALISGAIVERMKFSAWVIFMVAWVIVVYAPVAHWVWAGSGWLFKMGALDFAGGTVVHFSSGCAALALAIVLGNRKDFLKSATIPHNLTQTLIGAGLLWFGWFGFNAGSALGSNVLAGLAFANTMIAASAAGVSWMLIEWTHGKPSALGVASGIVAGLVAITPAAGFVAPWGALVLGLLVGVLCCYAVRLKFKLKLDDSLDVFGIHGVGGLFGAIMTGVLAIEGKGLVSGNSAQVGIQTIGVLSAGLYSFVVTLVIAYALKATIGIRVTPEQESEGTDVNQHGEKAYN